MAKRKACGIFEAHQQPRARFSARSIKDGQTLATHRSRSQAAARWRKCWSLLAEEKLRLLKTVAGEPGWQVARLASPGKPFEASPGTSRRGCWVITHTFVWKRSAVLSMRCLAGV